MYMYFDNKIEFGDFKVKFKEGIPKYLKSDK